MIECRDCSKEFNPNDPYHRKHGYYNQCADCAIEHKADKVKPYKAITIINDDGDWQGIKVVTASEFEQYQKANSVYPDGSSPNENDDKSDVD